LGSAIQRPRAHYLSASDFKGKTLISDYFFTRLGILRRGK
jgi:hypothetical protein